MKLAALFKPRQAPVEAPPAAPAGAGRVLSELEYRQLCAADDYHQDDDLARFRLARAQLYAASGEVSIAEPGVLLLATAIGMLARPLRIIEFGGGTGYHATTLQRLSPGAVARYLVVETPKQVAIANGKVDGVDFAAEIPSEPFDIVFSSGALQCTQAPLAYLRDLCALDAPVMAFARNAFSDQPVYFEQRSRLFNHGAGPAPAGFEDRMTTMYVQTLKESDFLAAIPANYHRAARSPNDTGVVENCTAYGFDYLFSRL